MAQEPTGADSKPAGRAYEPATVVLDRPWQWSDLGGALQRELEAALAAGIAHRRWFGAKTRVIRSLTLVDAIALTDDTRLLLVEIAYAQGNSETYQIPLAIASGEAARVIAYSEIWARVQWPPDNSAVLYDALGQERFSQSILALCSRRASVRGVAGEVTLWPTPAFGMLRGPADQTLVPRVLGGEQSNTSVAFGQRLVLKVFRRVEHGVNPDLEIADFLSTVGFAHTAPLAAACEYRRAGEPPWTLAVVQAFVPNRGDAWAFTLEQLRRIAHEAAPPSAAETGPPADRRMVRASSRAIPSQVRDRFADFLPRAELLGKRTAELHIALASRKDIPDFSPQPLSTDDRRRWLENVDTLARESYAMLGQGLGHFSRETQQRARRVLAQEGALHGRLRQAADVPVDAAKIRCHGDYHLGQVLVTDDDFVIIDFEGEPARPLDERRAKQLAMRDVAGMIRSFHYASCTVASGDDGGQDAADQAGLCADWYFWTSVAFLAAYRRTAAGRAFLPQADDALDRLLGVCLLEKAVYELRYELNNRPDWVYLPLVALEDLLAVAAS